MRRSLHQSQLLALILALAVASLTVLSCQSGTRSASVESAQGRSTESGSTAGPASEQAGETQTSSSALKRVTFIFEPDRRYNEVFLAGTFNGWSTDTTPMKLTGDHYETTLFLAKGEHRYKFVADGNWITDQRAKSFADDGYGGQNSVVEVDDSFPGIVVAVGDGRIMTEGLSHHEDAWERSLSTDGTVTLRVRTWSGDVETVELCSNPIPDHAPAEKPSTGAGEQMTWHDYPCIPMTLVDKDGTYDYFEATLAEPRFTYFFLLKDGGTELVLDRQGAREAPTGSLNLFRFNASEVAAFSTPDWVKEAVIYQIFPERFANGDTSNDPDFSEWYYEGVNRLPARPMASTST
jgi:hypothetical protein